MNNLGIYLISISVILIIIKIISKRSNTSAENGSIAIGKNNYGKIELTNPAPKENNFWKVWDFSIGVLGIIGFLVTIWPMFK